MARSRSRHARDQIYFFCVITPGTYQSIFHRSPSLMTLPAATRFLAVAVLQRPRVDVQLAVDDLLTSRHHLVDDILGHDRRCNRQYRCRRP